MEGEQRTREESDLLKRSTKKTKMDASLISDSVEVVMETQELDMNVEGHDSQSNDIGTSKPSFKDTLIERNEQSFKGVYLEEEGFVSDDE
ncbi:hypothetical protein PTKIN_Ptkin10aG0151400 [Pterospermum kingtungense]